MQVNVPEGTIEIKEYEYRGNDEITDISFPISLKRIGKEAFYNCRNLNKVILPNNIEYIDDGVFCFCKAVIFVPKSIKYIGRHAFSSECVVFFEGKKDSFKGYYDSHYEADYPDSFYRGPSMGQELVEDFFYQEGCKLYYEKSLDDFNRYLSQN